MYGSLIMYSIASSGFCIKQLPKRMYTLCIEMLRELSILRYSQDWPFLMETSDTNLFRTLCNNPSPTSRDSRSVKYCTVENFKSEILSIVNNIVPKIVDIYNNDIYFRFVSPMQTTTQSIVHRDIWFHTITSEWSFLPESSNLKLWLPLYYSSVPYGIGVIPGSHKDFPYDFDYINGPQGPSFIPHNKLTHGDLTPLKIPIGSGLFFPPTLLHGGLDINKFSPRVSCELTLLI